MKDIIAAFDARHELLLCHLPKLQVSSEVIPGTGQLTDEGLGDKNISSVHQANLVYHPKLLRTNSDGLINQPFSTPSGTSRCSPSLQSPSTSKLPKLPLRRLSSDSTGRATQAQDFETARHFYQQSNRFNANGLPAKRYSIPETKAVPFGSPPAQEDQNLARRRSTSDCCSSASLRRRRALSTSVCEGATWKVKLHKRNLNVEDDESYDSGGSMSRSSSSSGFSSQSSLF